MSPVLDDGMSKGARSDHGEPKQRPHVGGRPPLRLVLVVGGRGSVTTLTDDETRVDSLRVAWQLDKFAAALEAEMAADVRVLDEIGSDDIGPDTAVLGTGSALRALAGRPREAILIELGVGSSTGLRQVEEARLAGGIDLATYRAWQKDRQTNDLMFGRIDVAEHMGARLGLRSETYCSFWLDGQPGLPRLVARYLQAYAAMVAPT